MANDNRVGQWIQTFKGIAFYPLDPRVGDINIDDIAHALANQCRFTGHCRHFYSVAQHSVLVSRLCAPALKLWGLLHDASEAYMSDVARPLKHSPEWSPFREAEQKVLRCVAERFGLPPGEPAEVKLADRIMLGVEARDLMSPLVSPANWKWCTDLAERARYTLVGGWAALAYRTARRALGYADKPGELIRCWGPHEARLRFMNEFNNLRLVGNLDEIHERLVA